MIRIRRSPVGEDSLAELAATIGALKVADPFSPVFVVAPSREAAISIRRHLALNARGGFTAVTYGTSTRLAQELAEAAGSLRGRRCLDPALKRGFVSSAIRRVVASSMQRPKGGSESALLELIASPPAVGALADSFGRLDEECHPEEIRHLLGDRRAGDLPLESRLVLEAYLEFKRLYSAAYFDDTDLFVTAREAVLAGSLEEIPSVVLYLPMSLTLAEERLCAALGNVVSVEAILGLTGDREADEYAAALAERLIASAAEPGGLDPSAVENESADPPSPSICTAIDAEEEVRTAVRMAQRWCTEGGDPTGIAIAYASARPYQRSVPEYLGEAGIAFWGGGRRTLGETIPGAVLRAVLDVAESGFRRDSVIALAHAIPERARGFEHGGRRYEVTPELWDRISREAGVTGGLDQWTVRLKDYASRAARRQRDSEVAAACRAACAFVEMLHSSIPSVNGGTGEVPASGDGSDGSGPGWGDVSTGLNDLFDLTLASTFGRASRADEENDIDGAAFERIRSSVAALSRLDSLGDSPNLGNVGYEVREILESMAPEGRRPNGLLIGPVHNLAGAVVDSVVVIGAIEGALPAPLSDDSLLAPVAAALGRPEVSRRGPSAPEQRLRLYTLLGSARRSVLSHPIADLRRRRPAQASWWLLDEANARRRSQNHESAGDPAEPAGRLITNRDLSSGRCGKWHIFVPSLEAGVRSLDSAERQEADLACVFEETRSGTPFEETSVVTESAALERRAARQAALSGPHLDEWWGLLRLGADYTDGLRLSPTGLEQWALCPYRYFLGEVLQLEELEKPEDVFDASPKDLGSAIHEILQRLFGNRSVAPTSDGASVEDASGRETLEGRLGRLRVLVDEVIASRIETGRLVGDRSLFDLQKPRILRALQNAVLLEEALELHLGLRPWRFEHDFDERIAIGDSGVELRVRGRADRIDRIERVDGQAALAVVDYKTGRLHRERQRELEAILGLLTKLSDPSEGLRGIESGEVRFADVGRADPVSFLAGGTFLQLPLYMFAAGELESGEIDEFLGLIWHIDLSTSQNALFGAWLAGSDLDDVASFISEMTEEISSGVFMPNPGEEAFGATAENCRHCDFDDVCPRDRSEIWRTKAQDETFLRFARLTAQVAEE